MPPFVSTGQSIPLENARIFTAQAVLFMINVRIIRKKQEKIWWNKIKAVPLHSLIRNDAATQQGVLTERLGNGLQNRVERFDSARHLNKGSFSVGFLFCLYTTLLSSFFTESTCFLSFFRNFGRNLKPSLFIGSLGANAIFEVTIWKPSDFRILPRYAYCKTTRR